MEILRHKTKVIKIGDIRIGGNNPVAIQSMLKTKTANVEAAIREIKQLECAGCEIVRLAIKDSSDARALKKIKKGVSLPLVADIHFNWKLALEAIDNGADKIRLNPGNIYKKNEIREVVSALKIAQIPLRIGVNSGSVRIADRPKVLGVRKGLKPNMSDFIVQSALDYIRIIEKFGFYDIVVSLKASNVLDTVEAYRKIAGVCAYPLHLGVTATGLPRQGAIKSSIAIGALLMEGIGDTIRVSLTDAPEEEVRVAKFILEALALRSFGHEIISCPTCGRCEVDLVKIVKEVENSLTGYPVSQLAGLTGKPANSSTSSPSLEPSRAQSRDRQTGKPIKLAIMGCVVNGPGEAKEADIGIAFGKNAGLLFKNGKPVKKIASSNCVDALLEEINKFNK